MVVPASIRSRVIAGVLLGLAMTPPPARAASAPQARLIHCGSDTCLRISGHRQRSAVAVRVGGQDLAVEGGRTWRVTVPLTTARAWLTSSGYALTLTLADTQAGTESKEAVALPPGALGPRVELASLVIRAH